MVDINDDNEKTSLLTPFDARYRACLCFNSRVGFYSFIVAKSPIKIMSRVKASMINPHQIGIKSTVSTTYFLLKISRFQSRYSQRKD